MPDVKPKLKVKSFIALKRDDVTSSIRYRKGNLLYLEHRTAELAFVTDNWKQSWYLL